MQDYKAILTYTISDTERSKQFTDFLENLGCIKQEDQSTYGIPHFTIRAFDEIDSYCKKNIKTEESVHLYKLYQISENEGYTILKVHLPSK